MTFQLGQTIPSTKGIGTIVSLPTDGGGWYGVEYDTPDGPFTNYFTAEDLQRGRDGCSVKPIGTAADPERMFSPVLPPWIVCDPPMPWASQDIAEYDEAKFPAPPDTSAEERAKFGMTYDEIYTEERKPQFDAWTDLDLILPYLGSSKERRAQARAAAKKAGMLDIYRLEALAYKIDKWRSNLKVMKDYFQACRDEQARQDLEYAASHPSFTGLGLNKPGTQIEIAYADPAFKRQYLIGDINPNGGVCDDCPAFGEAALVTRYRVLCNASHQE